MATEEGVHSAQTVSEAFVEQYYNLVEKVPHEAHRFYVDSSVVSRPLPDGTMMSFTSLEDIKKHFLSSDYEGTTFDVLSVDSQSSLEDGIFIMVIGFVTGKDNFKRKFSQMFYLALQNTVYVVVNDIYRFVDEKSSTPTTVTAETEVEKPVDEIKKTEPVHKIDAPAEKIVNAAEVKEVVAVDTTPLDNGNNKHSDEKAVTAQNPKEPDAETAAPPLDGAKKSYAAMVLSMSRSAAPFQVKAAPVQKPKSMAQHKLRAAPTPKAPAAVSKREKRSDQKMVDEPGTSIFVANLPMDAMPPQLYELFKDFGPIKENGIQIRSNRASGRCFGFVAFESVASVQSVLKAAKSNPFKLAEHKLGVKEKQVDYDGSKPSGGRSGGGSTENSSAVGSKTQTGSAVGSKTQTGSAVGSKTQTGSADGSKTENGSADGSMTENGEDDGFKPIRSRKNRGERRGDRNANGDNKKQ